MRADDDPWRDVLGIVAVQGNRLDAPYLRRGAGILGVTDLLDRALRPGHSEGSLSSQ